MTVGGVVTSCLVQVDDDFPEIIGNRGGKSPQPLVTSWSKFINRGKLLVTLGDLVCLSDRMIQGSVIEDKRILLIRVFVYFGEPYDI